MLFAIENALIEVRDAPAQWDVVVEEVRELACSLASVGVAPCAERHENLLVLAECHVTMHHG